MTALACAAACLAPAVSGGVAAAGSTDPAQHLFARGVEAARQGHWDDARMAFEGAHALSTRPVILINLAGAQARTGFLKEAVANYRAIASDDGTDTAPFRDAAAAVVATLEPRIPRIRLRAALDIADVIKIDGVGVASSLVGEPQPVNPGSHIVTVVRAGVERVHIEVSLAEGETHDVSLRPPPALHLEAPEPRDPTHAFVPTTERSAVPPAVHPRRAWWRSPWLWTAVATAAGAATAGFVLVAHDGQPQFSGSVSPGIIYVH